MNLNKVYLIGRLAGEPEVRNTASGQMVCSMRLATNRVWTNRATNEKNEQVEFHTVIAWGKLAEISQKYLRKGQLAFIEGRLQTRSWQGQDGAKRYRTEIVAESLQLGPKAAGASQQASSPAAPAMDSISPDDIPVIHEEEPVANPVAAQDPQESEIDLKNIPF